MRDIRIGFIGAGRVGTALGARLKEAGYGVTGVWSRSPQSRNRFLQYVPGTRAWEDPQGVLRSSELIFVTTSDDAIAEVVGGLPWRPGHKVVHTSGALSLDVLEGARKAGAEVGSFHPCQAFATVEQALQNLPGSTIGIEASSEGLRVLLERMAEDIGCSYVLVPPEGKVLYHAAAVFASNYMVTLVDVALRLLERLDIERTAALGLLSPLLRGTLTNIKNLGIPQGLTGPIARGDLATVKKHVEALGEKAPELLELYARLGLETIPIGVGKGTLSSERAEALREILEGVLEALTGEQRK